MKQLSNSELATLKARCQVAVRRKYAVGQGLHYAELLAAETKQAVSRTGMADGSPEHLLALCEEVENLRAGKPVKVEPVKVEPVKVEPVKVEVVAEETVEVAEGVEEGELESEPVALPSAVELDTMSKAELVDVARKSGIENRIRGMSKNELLKTLKDLRG